MSDNGNVTKVLRIIAGFLFTILIASVGWAFIQVRDLPSTYVTKLELSDTKKDLCDRLERIENKIDAILLSDRF